MSGREAASHVLLKILNPEAVGDAWWNFRIKMHSDSSSRLFSALL